MSLRGDTLCSALEANKLIFDNILFAIHLMTWGFSYLFLNNYHWLVLISAIALLLSITAHHFHFFSVEIVCQISATSCTLGVLLLSYKDRNAPMIDGDYIRCVMGKFRFDDCKEEFYPRPILNWVVVFGCLLCCDVSCFMWTIVTDLMRSACFVESRVKLRDLSCAPAATRTAPRAATHASSLVASETQLTAPFLAPQTVDNSSYSVSTDAEGNCPQVICQKLAKSNNSKSFPEQVSHPSAAPLSPDIEVFYPSDLNILRCIEKGAQGCVVLASTEFYNRVAVKFFSEQMKNWSTSGGREMINSLRVSNHPNLVQTRGIVYASEQARNENQLPTGFVMEYMPDESLYSVIHDKNISYDEKDILSWTQQAASALSFLHKRDLLHRDVKPGNMLLGNRRKLLKLGDLGLSKATRIDMTPAVGTFVYMAPEVMNLNGRSNYDKKCDVYSLSCSIWEMVYRKTPFFDFQGSCLIFCEKVCGPNGKRPAVDESCPPQLAKVIVRSWCAEPTARPTMQEIHTIIKKELEALGNSIEEGDGK